MENVRLAQLRAGDDCQLVVGYVAAQGDHYLAVYAYNDGQLSTILEQSYEQYLVEDITGGGSQDLILMSTQEDGGVQIELLTVDKEGGFRLCIGGGRSWLRPAQLSGAGRLDGHFRQQSGQCAAPFR